MNKEANSIKVAIILGASRPERQSVKVAKAIEAIAEKLPNIIPIFIDVNDYKLDFDHNQGIPEYKQKIEQADAIIIVSPEYNHSFPGKLKSLLDTEFNVYKHKPVALAGVSNGDFGGARVIESLLPVVVALRMTVTNLNLYFPKIRDIFDETGNFNDPIYPQRIEKMLSELTTFAKIIKLGQQALE